MILNGFLWGLGFTLALALTAIVVYVLYAVGYFIYNKIVESRQIKELVGCSNQTELYNFKRKDCGCK